ncbi:cell division protein SepF [Halalkalicoccus sp. NIPERK01]|uniref:cell division protein SepF n=1 Tax=Halalkalicoccus sp. NIPERK01 TaxID=3053469 RepID=UPI00256F25E2|nr:cell division protein SepF [Halalkalicoccus sp. NIPERK01]MDL5362161.1 cell division protein SepF [Halalkalicoccus sp. NIPERK01]
MGFMDKLLGEQGSHRRGRSVEDYVEVDVGDIEAAPAEAGTRVHIAEIDGQRDLIAIKDAIYDGDVVIADIVRLRTSDSTVEHIIDELRQVAHEVDGDIVQKGDDQIIVTPTGVSISRSKLGR